jgi:hypothetical protein
MDQNNQKNEFSFSFTKTHLITKLGAIGLVALTLSACNVTMGTPQTASEGIGFRQARFAEMSVMKAWRDCRDEALALDQSAKVKGLASQYLASAKAIEACEANAGPEIAGLNKEERMRTIAVASLNFLKGGDMDRARSSFQNFKQYFGNADLRFPDGTSYRETMSILLTMSEPSSIGVFSVANVSPTLKSELRRARYWQRN